MRFIRIVRFVRIRISFGSDFRDFSINRKFEIDIGCFPSELEHQKIEERNCVNGHVKHLSYILDFFEKGENLYFFGFLYSSKIKYQNLIHSKKQGYSQQLL